MPVVKDASEILLGVLPLEGMDLIVDPARQKLVGAHGDQVVYLAKKAYNHAGYEKIGLY
ncbi:MAG: hypothetical protein LBG72_03275 [Spirochaetaceae bacterium]|jgi:hypothetical protein|nr:hypothetical protein [Spirochaetaceae bacterium]